jgi:hypothetical protein
MASSSGRKRILSAKEDAGGGACASPCSSAISPSMRSPVSGLVDELRATPYLLTRKTSELQTALCESVHQICCGSLDLPILISASVRFVTQP